MPDSIPDTPDADFSPSPGSRPASMLEDASNQELVAAWRRGSDQAAGILVRRYMVRLTALARSRLSRKLARRLDPEDIVLSAWRSFFIAASDGRLSVPGDDDLWPLLVTLTLRKLSRQRARQSAARRDIDLETPLDSVSDWRSAIARDPTPEEAALLADEVEALLAALNATDREVLVRRLEGADHAAIASALQCSERSVRRSMQRIRALVAEREPRSSTPLDVPSGLANARPPDPPHVDDCSTDVHELSPPTFADKEFLLKSLIGRGGFGRVYRAIRHADGADVAVKFLTKRFWKDARATQSLIDESQRLSALSHPNIVRHHGWGRTARGATFLVLDWIDGCNLFDWRRTAEPSARETLNCGLAVAEALLAAHAVGVIHGDLTPGNVLRHRDGRFLLTDFGLARWIGRPSRTAGGTPGWLAPEQVSDAFGPVGARTDVYGLGGLLFAVWTGLPPSRGDDVPRILAAVLSSRPCEPASHFRSGIPPRLDELIASCLSKEAGERPASIAAVREALQRVQHELMPVGGAP
ncbi:MAG: protein kinase [Planctomyces sp.]|nr:protein kinase [Planctomyces sp.]